MNGYNHLRRSSRDISHGQGYDYDPSRYGPPSSAQALPRRPSDPQGEHRAPARKYSESSSTSFSNDATRPPIITSEMSDLEKLRALKKAIMDGQLPGYDATPKPQALEALLYDKPRAGITTHAHKEDSKMDVYDQRDGYQDSQHAAISTITGPAPVSPRNQMETPKRQTADNGPTALPLSYGTDNSTKIASPNEEIQSPASMIISPTTDLRPMPYPSFADQEMASAPNLATQNPTEEVTRSLAGGVKPVTDSGASVPASDKPNQQPPSGPRQPNIPPAPTDPTHQDPETRNRRNTYSNDPRRPEDSRYHDHRPPYTSDRNEPNQARPRSPESNARGGYRRPPSPDSRNGYSGRPRSPGNGRRYDSFDSGSRYPGNRSPSRTSFSEPKGFDSRAMDISRAQPREPYSNDRSSISTSARGYPYDREPVRYSDVADERRLSGRSETSERDARMSFFEGPRTGLPSGNPGVSRPSDLQLSSRLSDGGKNADERGSRYRPDMYPPPPPSSLLSTGGPATPLESHSSVPNIKKEASEDEDRGRRSATPRSVGESIPSRQPGFAPTRTPDGLPTRPPPANEEAQASRSSLMPDRIAEPRSFVPLAARLTSPNDPASRTLRGGPPPPGSGAMRGPSLDVRRPADEVRYASPADSWGSGGRMDDPIRRDSAYSRTEDARDFSRLSLRGNEWDRPRSPDRYGPSVPARQPVPQTGYAYRRERSSSPPRRGSTYSRPGYPDVDDSRGGVKRPTEPDYRRVPPPASEWRPRDEYDSRAPLPLRPAYADPRAQYTRPAAPPDQYRAYEQYPPDTRPRPPVYGNDRYTPEPEWSGRGPYRR